jgi:hypothetical protein
VVVMMMMTAAIFPPTDSQVLPMLQRLELDIGAGVSDSSPLSSTLPALHISATCCVFVPEVGYVLADACGALWVVHEMSLAVVSHRCVLLLLLLLLLLASASSSASPAPLTPSSPGS